MRARLRDLWLPAVVAGACDAGLIAPGMLSPAFSDYELEAEPSLQALREGDVDGFLALAPVYGGSLILRAPFRVPGVERSPHGTARGALDLGRAASPAAGDGRMD
jgi:hypothetical protein